MIELTKAVLARHPLPPLSGGSKNARGRIMIVGGHPNVPGAVLLTAEAALRAGAGRLQIAVPPELVVPVGVACVEAATVPYDRVTEFLADVDAVAIGAGTFASDEFSNVCASVFRDYHGALAVDAGAFSALAEHPHVLEGRSIPAVLTPHHDELARLLGETSEAVEADPLRATMQAASQFASVVIGKGERSVIATPHGESFRFSGGSVALAVSGSGDVLSGILAGLLARGADPLTAALWATAVHGEAGRLLEARIGIGALSRELPIVVPQILRDWNGNRT